jgi:predicted ATPase
MSEKGLFKNQKKTKNQTNKRKEQRKWNDPINNPPHSSNPRNGHQMEVRQEMSCVNKTNKASKVKQEMFCDNKTNKANEVSA